MLMHTCLNPELILRALKKMPDLLSKDAGISMTNVHEKSGVKWYLQKDRRKYVKVWIPGILQK